MKLLEFPTDIVTAAAKAAARRELRIVTDSLAQPQPVRALWSAYNAHHAYLRTFLSLPSGPCLLYVTERFTRICDGGMPEAAAFLAAAERGLQILILENTKS